MRPHSRLATATLLLACLPFAACRTPMDLPPQFSRLQGREFEATTADDAVLRVREVRDPTVGSDAKFWLEALHGDFIDQRGYTLVDSGDVDDESGVDGCWLECYANVGGERVDYLVAVWPRQRGMLAWLGLGYSAVQVAEFAARAKVFAAHVADVRAKLKTVRG